MIIRWTFVYLLIISLACAKTNDSLNIFYKHVEENIKNQNGLRAFKEATLDSVEIYFSGISEEFINKHENYIYKNNINIYFEHNKIQQESLRGKLLIYGFHYFLNNKNITTIELQKELKNLEESKNRYYIERNKIKNKKLLNIININNSNWGKGDTLDVILPINMNRKSVYYSTYPYTLDYSSADDTLKLRGILVEKQYQSLPESQQIDSLSLVYRLKLIEHSNKKIRMFGKLYSEGDTFDLHLEAYGRPIFSSSEN